jgi:TolB-like protein/Tfp pilus assembly protein PilF
MRFSFGKYQLDTKARSLLRHGRRVSVEPKVFDVLAYLIEQRERVVPQDELLGLLWPGVSVSPAALSQTVHRARQAVGDDGEQQRVLRTEYGHGFRFVAEVSVVSAAEAVPLMPSHSRSRLAAAAGVAALLLVAVVAWLLNQPTPAPLPGQPSIAVLPFVNMSGDPEHEYFSDGITEELIHTLTAVEGIRVVGRTSSFFFKEKDMDLRTIGETLGVSNLLEGSVRRSGPRLRITAQLVSAADGLHLWSNSYDRELADIFAIQEEIAGHIAQALQVELGLEVAKSIADRTTDSLDAYTWVLRGNEIRSRQTEADLESAREAFERAIALDPEYLPAYTESAFASRNMYSWGLGSVEDTLAHAERRLRQALEIDADYGHAHTELGAVLAYRADWAKAEEAFLKGLALDPSDPSASFKYGYALANFRGRPEEAVALMEWPSRVNPLDWEAVNEYARALAMAGRVEEAALELQRILEVDPTYSYTYYTLGELDIWFRNQYASGTRWHLEAFDRDPRGAELPIVIASIFLDLGDAASAERWVEVMERNSAGGAGSDLAEFTLALYRGDMASAESISLRLSGAVQPRDFFRYIQHFAWLRVLQRTDPDLARQAYERLYPELLQKNPPVDAWNHAAAISLADWMRRAGEDAKSDSLLEQSLSVIRETTDRFYFPASATAYLLQGETDRALAALREAIDSGWRSGWWLLQREPIYAPLWERPEFQAMMAEVRADMAAQLAELREMERGGELPAIPRDGANPR